MGDEDAVTVVGIILIVDILTVVGRFYSRWYTKSGFGWDDWTILIALLLSLLARILTIYAWCGAGVAGTVSSTGPAAASNFDPDYVFTPEDVIYTKITLPMSALYFLVTSTTKISLLLLFPPFFFIHRNFRLQVYVALGVVVAFWISSTAADCLDCVPLEWMWKNGNADPRYCINYNTFWLVTGIFESVIDLGIKKLGVVGVLILGVCHWIVEKYLREVDQKGILLDAGRQIDLDCIVCATGFDTSGVPQFPVRGLHDLSLAQRFEPNAEAYLSLAANGFLNLFSMLGPNAGVGSGALTPVIEAEGDYIIKCVRKLQKEGYSTMMVKKERVSDWVEYCQTYFQKTVYTDQCKSWYKGSGGRGDHAALRAPRWEDLDWEISADTKNKLRCLGNGWSSTQIESSGGDPAWYIDPIFQDAPSQDALRRTLPTE
ncbi:hypothetical protein LQW54_012534 [Pestalotiopsis sp. IQ-011]